MKNIIVRLLIFSTLISILGLLGANNEVSAAIKCRSMSYGGGKKIMCDGVDYKWINEHYSQTRWEGVNGISYAAIRRSDGAWKERTDYSGYSATARLSHKNKSATYYH